MGGNIMRYVGSKNKLSKELVPIIQSYITENTKGYLEPFVGGANMIDKVKCKNKIGCDIHKELIALLNKVKNDVQSIPDTITEEEYNNVKNNRQIYKDWYVGLVGFCGSFGAKYFGGFARGFKEDKITPRDAPNEAIRNLRKQSSNLKDILFYNCSFLDIPKDIEGYVIYCDPPYRGTTKYKTDIFPYEDFYKWCKDMSKNNIVLISEYNMPDEFKCIWEMQVTTSLNSRRKTCDKSKNRIEKLFICK